MRRLYNILSRPVTNYFSYILVSSSAWPHVRPSLIRIHPRPLLRLGYRTLLILLPCLRDIVRQRVIRVGRAE